MEADERIRCTTSQLLILCWLLGVGSGQSRSLSRSNARCPFEELSALGCVYRQAAAYIQVIPRRQTGTSPPHPRGFDLFLLCLFSRSFPPSLKAVPPPPHFYPCP
ncbi:hypothetical protein QBC37DRAFT_110029 [Rhypophila decipiens]|uniref:Secreted protein n=1 Tax=Rhypophila decipiens TaxID=261697 RepID=A0AAN7BFN5_9PEZI|nr:hypothetical protein QBC37DRAFT_110029 [Rhypophila decipiens]